MLIRFTFPTENYCGNGIIGKHVYFQGSRCPTKEEVVKQLTAYNDDEVRMSDAYPEYEPYTFDYHKCLLTIEQIEKEDKFPQINGSKIIDSVPCNTKYGVFYITCSIITPILFENE